MFRILLICLWFSALMSGGASTAFALEPVDVTQDQAAIDLSRSIELYPAAGPSIQVKTAPDASGVISRIEVRSDAEQSSGNWLAFALANKSDEQVDRLIVAPHFRLAGSGFLWPDLGSARIASITPSQGFALDRQASKDADVFRITLDPGTVVTLVAEMSSDSVQQLILWEPDAYKDAVNSYTLYEGIVLGIAGLLAVFLTIIFVVKGSAMFPATAALAWSVLAYICVDFGFIGKIFAVTPGELNFWRATAEVSLAATLVIFLFAYLHLNRWNTRFSYLVLTWLLGLIVLFGVAVVAPEIAAGIARISFAASSIAGFVLIIVLSIRQFDRAILLIPTWCLIVVWMLGAWQTVSGQLVNDIIQPALGGGLVLIVMLLSFTVLQHAFAGGTLVHGLVSDVERQALALVGSGDSVWDWDVDRDELFVGAETSKALGYRATDLNGSPRQWLDILHPSDRDRFKSTMDVMLDHRRGRIEQEFRLRARNGQYHWLAIRARPVIGSDGEVLRCVGTVHDVTDKRVAHERLLHDAVHDNLTGLPNAQLFLDRMETAMSLARADDRIRPAVFLIDFDRFSQINESLGVSVGDSVLITMARRLSRILKPQDCLARWHGDQFAILLLSETDPDRIASFADSLKRSLKSPVNFSEQEITVTASIGLLSWSSEQTRPENMIKDAEIAMFQAKRVGGDRIEPFRPAFRNQQNPALHMESELRRAIERHEITMVYQPIFDLSTRSIAGVESLMRWHHPTRGLIMPTEFIPLAEKSGLIIPLGLFAMQQAAMEVAQWQEKLKNDAIFVSVNISSRQLLRHDLINDVKTVLSKSKIPAETLKLELTESLVMENPEQSSLVLKRVKALGAGLSLDDFGTGFSSLSQLMRFPFDTIKIDRSFVASAGGKGRPIILRSIVQMAHDLGMKVVAEGAETDQDALELRQLGCEFAQGFLFGEPMTGEVALQALQQDYGKRG